MWTCKLQVSVHATSEARIRNRPGGIKVLKGIIPGAIMLNQHSFAVFCGRDLRNKGVLVVRHESDFENFGSWLPGRRTAKPSQLRIIVQFADHVNEGVCAWWDNGQLVLSKSSEITLHPSSFIIEEERKIIIF